MGSFQCHARFLGRRVFTWVAHLHSKSSEVLQRILINGTDDAILAAQITKRSQVMGFGEYLVTGYEECLGTSYPN